ncbi:MAG: hypothetical protein IPN03_18570 [Holophagales bacterium]|nr:hypothetical protein [Holophagales bacterium]
MAQTSRSSSTRRCPGERITGYATGCFPSLAPADRIRFLIQHDCFEICALLAADDFASYAKERGIDTDVKRLERLDRLGIFRPMMRVRRPWIREKQEQRPNGHMETIGLLAEGEEWNGPLREGHARFAQERETLEWYRENGHLWHPAERPYLPWEKRSRDEPHRPVDLALYSRFQVQDLARRQDLFTQEIHLDAFAETDAEGFRKLAENLDQMLKRDLDCVRTVPYDDAVAFLAQALASRYFPQTQTDRRTISVRSSIGFDPWDWWKYAGSWAASAILSELGTTAEAVRLFVSHLQTTARYADPLAAWYDLVCFVALDERERLRGDAKRAQDLYAMEHMGRLFYAELTGTALSPPDEGQTWTRDSLYGPGITNDTLAHLECIANQYHLNPRPRLLLVVEGPGEAEQFPRILAELLGQRPAVLGIEVRTLGGVGEFTGRRNQDPYGALEKLIDDHHHRGTPVVIVLDSENDVPRVAKRLRGARSRLNPSRALTRPEYVHLWERSIEFDNFSHAEIAEALSVVAERRAQFAEEEIEEAMAAYDERKGDPLAALYSARLNYGLSKPDLLRVLVSRVIAAGATELDEKGDGKRPLVRLLQRVAGLAAGNTFPITRKCWENNQASGYFGAIEPDP